jgi:hypothetical protein
MALNTTNKIFKNRGKDIKYLNKDFQSFRNNLIEFSKTYFPKTYSDFNESSPGMLFIEMASYIGDVLSYYTDDTLKESLMLHAEDIRNILSLAQYLGYKPKVTSPAITTLSVYQLVPSIGSGVNNRPDERFYLRIKEGMIVTSTQSSINFVTTDIVDFADPNGRTVDVYERDTNTGEPTFYLIKKLVNGISATLVSKDFTFGSYTPFSTVDLTETNIIQIYDVRDSDGNKWYEVPYLAQESIFIEQPNNELNSPDLVQFKDTVPYVLKSIKTSRRFITRVNEDSTTTLTFGSGDPTASDELLIPNLKNVGLGLPNSISRLEESFDPTNFLKTKTYGSSPSNTTLTVRYYIGGGVASNVGVGDLSRITGIQFDNDVNSYTESERAIYNSLLSTVAVDNEIPASGGRGGESVEEIRQNSLANFSSQNRAVTAKDYTVRCLSMPSKFGSVSKAFAIADGKLDNNSPSSILASPNNLQQFSDLVISFLDRDSSDVNDTVIKDEIRDFLVGKIDNINEKNNPFGINLYVLGYDLNGHLTPVNTAVKQNLKTYLQEYKMLTDGINIVDGFIVNIGINFEISVYSNYNRSEVLLNCIQELQQYFQIDNWSFNDTINISEVELLLANIDGVQSVPKLEFVNKCNGQYSKNSYNITEATKDKIIYPSLDPCVFEIKFPNKDIQGRVR